MSLTSLESLQKTCATGEQLWKRILQDDCVDRDITDMESMDRMRGIYRAMREAKDQYDGALVSNSGLSGGDGLRVEQALAEGKLFCGDFIGTVMTTALKEAESNACMKRIVAAPTAGSCGVLPAVLLTCADFRGYSEEQMAQAMYVAAGIGDVIAFRSSISGAMGGCQAEIGSASAMAAGAMAFLAGGTTETIFHAAALALKSLLGLSCDPVAGLVEVPCVKRNVIGAVNAVTAADMALAGVRSRIPPDEVIDAMRAIGDAMPACLKETGTGGLAVTPAGEAYRELLETTEF